MVDDGSIQTLKNQKTPKHMLRGTAIKRAMLHLCSMHQCTMVDAMHRPCAQIAIFYHPDYTVGSGVSPDPALRLAGSTADRELHPAPKIMVATIALLWLDVKSG
jgi:hypothetical protein